MYTVMFIDQSFCAKSEAAVQHRKYEKLAKLIRATFQTRFSLLKLEVIIVCNPQLISGSRKWPAKF